MAAGEPVVQPEMYSDLGLWRQEGRQVSGVSQKHSQWGQCPGKQKALQMVSMTNLKRYYEHKENKMSNKKTTSMES